MKKNWLLALLCCVCTVAISCDDDDDPVSNGNGGNTESEEETGGSSSDAAPSVLITTSAGSDTFTVNLTTSNSASQYGYMASTTALSSISAADIISGTLNAYSAGVYDTATSGTFRSTVVEADASTTYYIYAAAVTAGGTYSSVASATVTTSAATTTYSYTLIDGVCYYYGNYDTGGSTYEYYVMLSDCDMSSTYEGSHFYMLDIISSTELNYETELIPAGTYTIGSSYANNELNAEYTLYGVSGDDDFDTLLSYTSGSVTVSVSGTTTTFEGTLTDEEGNSHNISYSGAIDMYDYTTYSTLTGDVETDYDGGTCTAYYEGDISGTGAPFWEFEIYNSSYDEALQLSVFGNSGFSTYADGIPTGSYTVDDTYSGDAGTCVPGYLYEYNGYYYPVYSWYLTLYTQSDTVYMGETYSPFGEGEVTITANTDGTYTIAVDVMDDRSTYTIKGSWTGTPEVIDYTSSVSTQSLKSASMGSIGPHATKYAISLNNRAFDKRALR